MVKFELGEGGLDSVLIDIRSRLREALETKRKNEKDMRINEALGMVNAVYRLIKEVEEESAEENV